MGTDRLGELEEVTLLAVRAVGDGAYGVAVQGAIERITSREVTLGAVHAALERLERKGLLRSAWSDSTPTRGGKKRRLFILVPAGQAALLAVKRSREALWNAAPKVARGRS